MRRSRHMFNTRKRHHVPLYFIFFFLSLLLLAGILFGALTINNLWCDAFISRQINIMPQTDPSQIPTTSALADPNREVRGVWIATVNNINYPSQPGLPAEALKAELDDILKTVSEANLNT